MNNNPASLGYVESAQTLLKGDTQEWSHADLLQVAEAAVLRNTGWPIGLVLRNEGRPKPTKDGVEARLQNYSSTGPGWDDFWSFNKNGSYYAVRLFEENYEQPNFQSSAGHPDRSVWFDIRVWRIAEVVLHSAALYRELPIPPAEPYLLSVGHGGLDGRELYTSTPRRHNSSTSSSG